jgi:hypothetical protein
MKGRERVLLGSGRVRFQRDYAEEDSKVTLKVLSFNQLRELVQ